LVRSMQIAHTGRFNEQAAGAEGGRCQHRQPLLPSGPTRPPSHQRRRLPERGPRGPPAL